MQLAAIVSAIVLLTAAVVAVLGVAIDRTVDR
jgi:hypothetical protein